MNTDFSLDRGIYNALAGLDQSKLDAETRVYLERTLRDFRRAGVDRDDPTRAKVKQLREQLVKSGQNSATTSSRTSAKSKSTRQTWLVCLTISLPPTSPGRTVRSLSAPTTPTTCPS